MFCENCGNPLTEDMLFCDECGTPVTNKNVSTGKRSINR